MRFLRLAGQGIADLGRSPFAQVMTLAAVALTALLAGLFLLLLVNLNDELVSSGGRFSFQVYWSEQASSELVLEQWDELRAMDALVEMKTFTPGQALDELGRSLGDAGETLTSMDGEAVLPHTAMLAFAPVEDDPEAFVQRTLAHLVRLDGVEDVHYSIPKLELAQAWVRFSRTVVWPAVGFLVLVGALIVGNTVRLSILDRADEMEILLLVGAGSGYIRIPLMIGGAVLGMSGAALSLGLLKLVQMALSDLCAAPPLNMQVRYLPLEYAAALIVGMAAAGALSGLVAVRE